jgi:hypothetical protein
MIAPLRDKVEEQSVALNHNVDKTNDNIRRLGRIVLDMERLDASMKVMRADIRKDLRARRRYFREEQKLIKKDIKQTEKLGNSFIGFRATLAGLAALSAGREFGQGDIMGGLQDSAIAVTAMLPEITSTVLGAVGLALGLKGGGGRGPTAGPRAAAPRGGMRGGMRGGPGFMALLPLALLGSSMLMGSPEKGDQTRVEMIQQQAVEDSLISPKEVNFFSVTVARFGGILDKLLGRKVKDPKVNVNDSDEKPKKPAPPEPPPPPKVDPVDSMLPGANRTPLDDSKKEALIQLVREGEGTADAQGYNKWFGGDTSLDITKMTGNEVMQEQLRRLKAGETPKFTDAFGVTSTSAAVGAGQFMKPEQVMIDMGLDPATTKMTPEVQDAMILHLAMDTRGVDPSDGIDMAEMERLGKEWASLTSYHGQKDITPQESIDRYNTILEGIRKRKGETKTDPLGPQSSLPMPSIQPSTPAPQIAAVAPEPPSPASITIDPNSAGTTGSEIASTALLSQYNIPAMFS